MIGKCRYCYSPAVIGRIGRRLTIADRFRRWRYRRENPDLMIVTGYFPPVYPRK